MRSGNPALRDDTFSRYGGYHEGAFDQTGFRTGEVVLGGTDAMTMDGAANKTGLLLACVMATSIFTWGAVTADPGRVGAFVITGLVGGLIFGLITAFKPEWAYWSAPIYALLEGLLLGGISQIANKMYPGIVLQAVALTFGVCAVMLALYRARVIKVTETFRSCVFAATGAICLVYFATFLLGLFGVRVPYIHQGGTIGIIFSLVVVGIASMNLMLDFDFIEKGAEVGAPKFMEWYAAFGLMVTLIWLYIEILNLLMKLRGRD